MLAALWQYWVSLNFDLTTDEWQWNPRESITRLEPDNDKESCQ